MLNRGVIGVELRNVSNSADFECGTDGCVELRDFWCGTEGFWVLKRCGPCVELRGSVLNCCVLGYDLLAQHYIR